ncbi:MAG: rubredoxin [Methanospirillum sp.]
MAEQMVRYKCIVCRYVHDPKVEDPTAGVPPGVEFEALPDDWVCPECMVGKGQFVMVEG